MSGNLERLQADNVAGRSGLPDQLHQGVATGAHVYTGAEIEFVPCLSLDDATARIPEPVRRKVDLAAGADAEKYARVDFPSGSVDIGEASSFLYVAFGKGGFARAAGRAAWQRGEQTWTVSYRSRGIDLRTVRYIEESGLAASSLSDQRTASGEGNANPLLFDEDFRGGLGHLPAAAQRFIQDPFLADHPLEWDHRAMRSPTDNWIAEHVWCWVIGNRYVSFLRAERWAFMGRSVDFSDESAALALVQQPWQVQGRVAHIDPDRIIDTQLSASRA
jgi:hypothetical protein